MSRIVRGLAGRCWDEDGRRYVDFTCGYGPVVVGHANAEVNEAVRNQLETGTLFSGDSPKVEELQQSIQRAFGKPIECHFVKTGSEAVAAAFRLARACTGRTTIIRCGFHGWHDQVVHPYLEWHQYDSPFTEHADVHGVLQMPDAVLTWLGETLSELESVFDESHDTIAALIIDPVQIREPVRENLNAIAHIVRRHGALLIVDEAKTCFRVAVNGVQGLCDVHADITILSKALANGFPLAAVTADSQIMAFKRGARLKGTYNGELVSIAASIKTIEILMRPSSIPTLHRTGQRIIDGLNDIFARTPLGARVQAVPYRWPCMPFVWFDSALRRSDQEIREDFHSRLAQHGVMFLKDHMSFTCLEHVDDDVDRLLSATEDIIVKSRHWQS